MKILSNYLEFIIESKLPQPVDRGTFLEKEKELKREKFTSREISELNKIDDIMAKTLVEYAYRTKL